MKDRTRKALEDLLGQVKQAKDGFGIYQQSKSMDSAVKEAEAALASQPSDLRAKLESLRDEWMREFQRLSQFHFGGEGERIGNVYRVCAERLTAIIEGKD